MTTYDRERRMFSRETHAYLDAKYPREQRRDPGRVAETHDLERELLAFAGHLVPTPVGDETWGRAAFREAKRQERTLPAYDAIITTLFVIANAHSEILAAREVALGAWNAGSWEYRIRCAREGVANARERVEQAAAHPVAAE